MVRNLELVGKTKVFAGCENAPPGLHRKKGGLTSRVSRGVRAVEANREVRAVFYSGGVTVRRMR